MRRFLLTAPILLTASPLLAQSSSSGATDILSCVHSLRDQNGGGCVEASSMPTLGMLHPLSENLFIHGGTDHVGVGTTAPDRKLGVTDNVANEGLVTLDNPNSAGFAGMYFEQGNAPRGWIGAVASGSFFGAPGTMQIGSQSRDLVFSVDSTEFFVERMRIEQGGDVGIGISNPTQQLDIGGQVRMDSNLFGDGSGTITTTTGAGDDTGYMGPVAGGTYINGIVDINGFVSGGALYDPVANTTTIFGNVKNFRETNPANPQTDIVYACIEGPEAAAYQRGTARLVDGQATVELPAHFAAVASDQNLTVQLTPRSARSRGLAVIEQSPEGFTVRELMEGTGSYEFAWEVKAVRKGYEDYEVIRPKLVRPHSARDLEQR